MQQFVIDTQELKVAVDIVVISEQGDDRYILLIKRKYEPFAGQYAIPGGFVNNDEELETAALRELQEETGVEAVTNLEQIATFGKVNRDPRKRVISIVYLAIINELPELLPAPGADNDTTDAVWIRLEDVQYPLAFDHDEIVKKALEKYSQIRN